jgi:hypothetical protein
MDSGLLARITFWVEQYARAIEAIRQGFIAALLRLFTRPKLSVWYDDKATEEVASQAANLSQRAQLAVEGAARQYIANVHAEITDTAPVVKSVTLPPIRGGADPVEVYTRPVEAFQRRMSTTGDQEVAQYAATFRATDLADGDTMLTSRAAEVAQMKAHGIKHYRRVIHPELSAGGTCGLCIAASTRIYNIATLQPMHLRCKCTVLEIAGDIDAGALMNEQDLEALYGAAGGTEGRKLKETRYKINEHGEYGPVLTKHGSPFNTPRKIGEEDPIGRAVRELEKLRPTLTILETKAAQGQDVREALDYQRKRIAFLTNVVESAA